MLLFEPARSRAAPPGPFLGSSYRQHYRKGTASTLFQPCAWEFAELLWCEDWWFPDRKQCTCLGIHHGVLWAFWSCLLLRSTLSLKLLQSIFQFSVPSAKIQLIPFYAWSSFVSVSDFFRGGHPSDVLSCHIYCTIAVGICVRSLHCPLQKKS